MKVRRKPGRGRTFEISKVNNRTKRIRPRRRLRYPSRNALLTGEGVAGGGRGGEFEYIFMRRWLIDPAGAVAFTAIGDDCQ